MRNIIEKLLPLHAPTGFENRLISEISRILSPQVSDVDFMGNLTIRIPGQGPKILVTCDIDEYSIVVTHIDSNGFIRFYPSGNLTVENILGAEVIFNSGIAGFIGSEEKPENSKLTFDRLFVDIGARNKREASELVKIGDHAGMNIPTRMTDSRVIGRDCCHAAASALTAACTDVGQTQNHLVFAFTTQGKLGGRGALTVANREKPDLIINLRKLDATDTPEHPDKAKIELGKGPVLIKAGSYITNYIYGNEVVQDTATSSGIQLQQAVDTNFNAPEYRMSGVHGSVPIMSLAIPTRVFGKFGGIVDIGDITDSSKLLVKILRKQLIK
ncbi:MAG TPA: hypothetical protein PKV16_02130 [Caldisericia bacterium]|nr:hypothetical protein [Caldisericia bacterium]HPF48111.1 hypothetical protein [Caldisericia bacterium]HPI83952.1 hypothetical protein [Caldisericia bacterium]HPQ92564.1 hypothetical protein [Caldisericia bacterium]HRV74338.1 hypothetical protein [Caldisericia bacterium]